MNESQFKPELVGKSREYSENDHREFTANKSAELTQRAEKVLGAGLLGIGAFFALVGIGDFLTSGEVSRTLSYIHITGAPDIISWIGQHLAQMPELMKTGGGASMITTGKLLLDQLQRK